MGETHSHAVAFVPAHDLPAHEIISFPPLLLHEVLHSELHVLLNTHGRGVPFNPAAGPIIYSNALAVAWPVSKSMVSSWTCYLARYWRDPSPIRSQLRGRTQSTHTHTEHITNPNKLASIYQTWWVDDIQRTMGYRLLNAYCSS